MPVPGRGAARAGCTAPRSRPRQLFPLEYAPTPHDEGRPLPARRSGSLRARPPCRGLGLRSGARLGRALARDRRARQGARRWSSARSSATPRRPRAWALRARWAEAAGESRRAGLRAAQGTAPARGPEGAQGRAQGAARAAARARPASARTCSACASASSRSSTAVAQDYEKDQRPHSAIRVHKEVLALDPEITRQRRRPSSALAAAPDPSLAADAKPKDLLAGRLRGVDPRARRRAREWDDARQARARELRHRRPTRATRCCVRAGRGDGADERLLPAVLPVRHGGGRRQVPRIDAATSSSTRDEYLKLGIGPPVEWTGGHFTGDARRDLRRRAASRA